LIKDLGSVAVVVKDSTAAKKWWVEKLGFEIRDDQGHWITVAPKGSAGPALHLCKSTRHEEGNTGILFHVDDLNKSYEELSKKGVRFTHPPKDEGWGPFAMFADPDGNEFWLEE
jgi:predicted enzyme related to lactoylglutathione lyase